MTKPHRRLATCALREVAVQMWGVDMWQILSESGVLAIVVATLVGREQKSGLFGLLTTLVDRWSEITLERERSRNLRHVLDRLPSGGEIIEHRSSQLRTVRIAPRGRADRGGAT